MDANIPRDGLQRQVNAKRKAQRDALDYAIAYLESENVSSSLHSKSIKTLRSMLADENTDFLHPYS